MEVPRGYRWIVGFLRLAVRAFFRQVQVTGLEHIPADRGGIIVSWHPNGMVDPGLILTHFPRQVVFGARHGLFKWPLLGMLLNSVGTVPIYRAVDLPSSDPDARQKANLRSLDALASEVARGSFSALFPEGVSHDAPHLMSLRPGAARLFYRARQVRDPSSEPPVIVPVGLHYDEKQIFRSSALVAFHPPLSLPAELDVDPTHDEVPRELALALTKEIERVLHDVVYATDDWDLHALMHRARKLIRAERAHRAGADPGPSAIDERVLGFARVRTGYYAKLESDPERVHELRRRVEEYDADLRALRLEDHELDRSPRLGRGWLAAIVLLQVIGVFLLLPPIVLLGYAVNLPTALGLIVLAKIAGRRRKDEATVKLLVGMVAFPLTWIGVGIAAGWGHSQLHLAFPSVPDRPILAGLLTAALAAAGGIVGVRYLRVARETARAVQVRLTRRRRWYAVDRLKAERAVLHDAMLGFVADVELPGSVAADGRVQQA